MRALVPALLTTALLAGCGGGDGGGGDGGGKSPEQQFASLGCAACHTMQAAGANGKTGPDLDELKPSVAAAEQQIAEGGGGMPGFSSRLSKAEIHALAVYVAESTGGG